MTQPTTSSAGRTAILTQPPLAALAASSSSVIPAIAITQSDETPMQSHAPQIDLSGSTAILQALTEAAPPLKEATTTLDQALADATNPLNSENEAPQLRQRFQPVVEKQPTMYVLDKQGNKHTLQDEIKKEDYSRRWCPSLQTVGECIALAGCAFTCCCFFTQCKEVLEVLSSCDCDCDPNENFYLEQKKQEVAHTINLYNAYEKTNWEHLVGPCETPQIKTMSCGEIYGTDYGCMTRHPKHTAITCAAIPGVPTAVAYIVTAALSAGGKTALPSIIQGLASSLGLTAFCCACYVCTEVVANKAVSSFAVTADQAQGAGNKSKLSTFGKAMFGDEKVNRDAQAGFSGKRNIGIDGEEIELQLLSPAKRNIAKQILAGKVHQEKMNFSGTDEAIMQQPKSTGINFNCFPCQDSGSSDPTDPPYLPSQQALNNQLDDLANEFLNLRSHQIDEDRKKTKPRPTGNNS